MFLNTFLGLSESDGLKGFPTIRRDDVPRRTAKQKDTCQKIAFLRCFI